MIEHVSIFAVFLEGILSFFSPCILPLIPLYISYLTGSCKQVNEDGTISYNRLKVMMNTNFFVLGISMTFVIMALSVGVIKQFLIDYEILMLIIGGVFLIVMGLSQLNVISIGNFAKTKRFNFSSDKKMGFLSAFVLGFVFSFAWSPCVGPILASVLSLAASASGTLSYLYILFYALGFVIPFLLLGIFTEKVLNFIKNKQNIVQWTIKIAGVIIIVLGLSMIVNGQKAILNLSAASTSNVVTNSSSSENATDSSEAENEVIDDPLYYNLVDLNGDYHNLYENKGQKLILTFSASWCPHCIAQMPIIDAFVKAHDDVNSVIIYSPVSSDLTLEELKEYLATLDIESTILIDENDTVAAAYGVSGYPMNFIFDSENNPYSYYPGQFTSDILETIYEMIDSEE